jgi:hypothetical protein
MKAYFEEPIIYPTAGSFPYVSEPFNTAKSVSENFVPFRFKPESLSVGNIIPLFLRDKLRRKITAFKLLEENWDSYHANAITDTAIERSLKVADNLATRFLPIQINVFPMRDGGVQFEFDATGWSAELEINPEGKMAFMQFDTAGNLLKENPLEDIDSLSNFLNTLTHFANAA